MKRFIIVFSFLSLFAILIPQKAHASHFAGSDLTYQCLGGISYKITLTFYRDCSGVSAPTSANISFNCSSNSGLNYSATLNKIPGTGNEVTPGCSAVPTECNGGNGYGLEEYVYEATVQLAPCNEWTMSYSSCCRNPVTNVPNNSSNSWYVEAKLNNLSAPCNSSPTFSNKPIAVICQNQNFTFNHGANDVDGDSLVYSFYAPMTSATATVNYAGMYSYTNFLSSLTPITINPATGDINMTPTMIGSTVTGVKVEEWREINGVPTKIGTVRRDLQLMVEFCNNQLPKLSGMDTNLTHTYNPSDTVYFYEMCLGPTISFDINGFDADSANPSVIGNPELFDITWNNGIPGGTFNAYHNGTDSAYANFTWTPTINDVSNIPKCFTATITDEACPYNGSQTFSYCITVRGMEVDIGTDTLLCEGESVNLTAIADTTTVNYRWFLNGTYTGKPLTDTTYLVLANDLGPGLHTVSIQTDDGGTTTQCPGVDIIDVEVVIQPDVNVSDTSYCEGGSVTFDAGPGSVYIWKLGGTTVGGSQLFTPTTGTGQYSVFVDGGHGTRCTDYADFYISEIPVPKLGNDTCIWLDDSPLSLDAGNVSSEYGYLWQDGSSKRYFDVTTSGVYYVSTFNKYIQPDVKCPDTVVVNVIDENNFIKHIQITVDGNPVEGAEESTEDNITICSHQKLKIKGPGAPSGHTYSYTWTQNGAPVDNNEFMVFRETDAGTNIVKLNAGGCVGDLEVKVEHCLVKTVNIITPNGDQWNEKFVFEGLENFPNSTLVIFNRWGKKVFESQNYQNDWDGDNLADGVYYWVLYLNDGKGDTEMSGPLTIMREGN
jgi:gliding motility-associated-like protein